MFPAFDSGPIKSQCRYCTQTFAKFNELIKHEASHHVPPPPPPPPPQNEIPVENEAGSSKSDDDDEEGTSEEEIENEDYEVNDLLDRFQDYWENLDNFDTVKQTSKRVRNTKPTRKKKAFKPKGTVVFDCSVYNMRRLKIDGKSKFQCLTCLVVLSVNARERLMIHQRTHNPSLSKRKSISSYKNKATSNSVEMANQNRSSKVKSFDCSIYNMERIKVAGQRNLKFKCLTCSVILSSRTRSDLLRHQRTHQGQQNVATTSPNNEVVISDHKNEGEDEVPSNIRTSNEWVGNYTNIGDGNQKKMKCLRCDKIISSRALRCHFLIHIGEKPFTCNFEKCPAAFSCEPYLNKHRVRVHGPKGNDKSSNRPGSSKRFLKVTPTPMDYSVYGFVKVKIDGSKSKYKCVTCGNIYTFHSRERFINHQKAHNKMPSVNIQPSFNHPNKLENFSNAFSKKSGHFQNGIYSLENFTNSNIIEDNEIEEPLADLNRYVEAEIPPIDPYVETLPINKANPYVQNDNSKLIESTLNIDQIEYDNLKNHFEKISSNSYECIECHKILSRGNHYNLKRHLNSHNKRERKADDFVESKDNENDDDFVEAEDEDDDYTKALQNAMKVLTKEERISIIKETLFKNVVVKLTKLPEEIVLKYTPKITNSHDEPGSIMNTSSESESEVVENESEENPESNYPSITVPEFVPTISIVECNSKPDKVNNESEQNPESNYPSITVPEFEPKIINVECNSKPDKVNNESEENHESNYPSITVPEFVPTTSNGECEYNSKPDKVNIESEESHESNYPSITVPEFVPTRSNVECNSKPGPLIDNEIAEIIESIEKIESHKAERLRQKQINTSKTIDMQPSTNNIIINQVSDIEVHVSNEKSAEDKKIDQDQNKYQMSELTHQNGAICENENGSTNLESILVCDNSFSNDLIGQGNEVNSNGASISKKEHNLSENENQLTDLYRVDGNNEVSSLTNSAQNEREDLSMSESESNNLNEVDVIFPEDDNVYIEPIEIENTPSEDESKNNDSAGGSDIESSEINYKSAALDESIANKVENEKEIPQSDLQVSQNQVQTEDSILSHSIFNEKEMNTLNVSIINSNQIDGENQKEVVEKNFEHNNDAICIGNESMLKVSNLSLPSNQEENEFTDLIKKENKLEDIIKSSSENLNPYESNLPSVQNQKENEVDDVNLPLTESESQIAVDNVEKALSDIENENKSTSSISFDDAIDANGLVNLQNEEIITTTSPIIDEIEDIKNSQQESRPENTNSMDVKESMSEVRNLSLPSNQEENEINDLIEKESILEEIVKSSPEICESENVKQDLEINQKASCSNCSSKSMRKLEIRNIFKFSISLLEAENELSESMPLIDNTNKVRSFCYKFRYNEAEDTSNANERHDSTELDEPEKVSNIGSFAKETNFFSESENTTTEETESSESIIKDGNTNELSSVVNESNSEVDDRENEDFPIKNECSSVAEMIFHEAEIIMNDSPREQPPEDSDEPESLIPNSKEPSNIALDGVLDCVYIDSRHQQKVEGASSTTSNENVKVANNLKLKLKSKTKTRIKTEMKSKTYLKKRKSILSNRNKSKKPILRTNLRHHTSTDNKDGHRQLIKVKYDLRKSSQKKLETIILPPVLDCNYINESNEGEQNQRIVDQDKKPILTSTSVRSTRSSKSLKEINIEKLGLSPSLMVRKRINKAKKTIYKRHKSKRIQNRLSCLTKSKSSADSKNKNVKKKEFDLAAEYNFEVLEMSGKSMYKCLTCLCVFSNGSKGMLKGHQNTHNKKEENENIDKVVDSSKELRRKSSRIKKERSNSISVDKNQIIENTDITIQLRSSNEKKDKIVEDISYNVQNVQSIRPTRILPRRNGKIYDYKQKSKTFILFDSSIYNMKRLKINGKSRFQCLTCSMIVASHSRGSLLAHQRTHSISLQKKTKGSQIKKKRSSTVNEDFNVTSDQNSSQKLSKVKLYDCSIYNMERVRIPGQKTKFKCLTCLALLSEHGRSRLLRHQRIHQRNSQEMEITLTTLQNNEIVVDESENCQNNETVIGEFENYQNIPKSEHSPNKAINEVPELSKSAIPTPGESYSDDWTAKFEKIGKHYRCLECNNELRKTWPSYLRHHYNTHFGIRPFECSKCSKSFFTNYNLRRHNDRVHLLEKLNEPKNDAVNGSPNVSIPNDLNVSVESVMLKILSEPIQTMMIQGEPVDLSRNYKKPESACETATGKEDEDSNSLPSLFPQEKNHNNYQQVSVHDQGKNQDDQNKASTSTSQQKPNTIHNNGPNFYDWTDDYIKIEFEHDEIEYECTSCKQILYDPSIDALKSHKLTHTIRIPQYKKNKLDDQFCPTDSGIISNSSEIPRSRSNKRKSYKNKSSNKGIRIDEELDLDLNDEEESLKINSKKENEAFRKDNYKRVVIEGKVKNECLTCGATISSNLRRHFRTHNKPIRP